MHHKKLVILTALILFIMGLVAINATTVQAASPTSCTWKTHKGASPGSYDQLFGVSAIATNNVWAVGDYTNSSNQTQTLIEHWNGTTWSSVASPNAGSNAGLNAVAADAANDIWAVGWYANASNVYFTLIEHWNGQTWSIVASPAPGTTFNDLNGVAALTGTNVWAVGVSTSTAGQTLIEHWNGAVWQVVPSPSPGSNGNGLDGIAVVSARSIWAVGNQFNGSSTSQTLIEHWNGTQWSVVSSANVGTGNNFLFGVTALSANNAWAVGSGNGQTQTVIEHWNGIQWSVVSSPMAAPDSGDNVISLASIAAISKKNLWAVGATSLSGTQESIVEHWNGTQWIRVSNPNPGTGFNGLFAVAVTPGSTQTWAVGDYGNIGSTGNVLIESHC